MSRHEERLTAFIREQHVENREPSLASLRSKSTYGTGPRHRDGWTVELNAVKVHLRPGEATGVVLGQGP